MSSGFPRKESIKEDTQSFLLSSYLGLSPLFRQLRQEQ